VLAVLVASFEVFHEASIERDKFENQVRDAMVSRPRFIVTGQKYVSLFAQGEHLFNVLQLWVCNEPEYRNVHSLAKNVTIRLEFYAENAGAPLFSFSSQWVSAVDPEVASFDGRSPFVDVPANDNPAKCIVLLQHRDDDDCYAHSFGKLIGTPNGKYQPYRLRPGRYRVHVCLRGDNVEQEFDLTLMNHGVRPEPEFLGVPKRVDAAIPSPAAEED
jgi:hypothetical protein